jgi:hypothetical protein
MRGKDAPIDLTASLFETIDALARIEAGFEEIEAGLIEITAALVEIRAALVNVISASVRAPSRLGFTSFELRSLRWGPLEERFPRSHDSAHLRAAGSVAGSRALA